MLSNAIKFTGPNGKIEIIQEVKNNEVEIDFKNANTDLSKAKVWLCDKEKNLEEVSNVKLDGSKMKVAFKGEHACVYIELQNSIYNNFTSQRLV